MNLKWRAISSDVRTPRLFRLAAAKCPKDFREHEGANAELKTRGAAVIAAPRHAAWRSAVS
jgi:hypothetical protein